MVFSSLAFLCFFLPVVFTLHLLIPSLKVRNALLVVASLLFYAYGEPTYILVMLLSTVLNWGFGVVLGRVQARRAVMAAAVVVNLGMLGVFKYSSMVAHSLEGLVGVAPPMPELVLPIGISFYTFQALSYVIDVYRGDVEPARSYGDVLLYISFFPQLIAGPIVKYHDVAAQIRERRVTVEGVATGLRRFSFGMAKKVLIANTMAAAVDSLYGVDVASLNVLAAWTAAVAYMLQIYFDFSGYSDMAIGLGSMFGFRFQENFNYPYVSGSIREFWRRWHISLSTWFKLYLYIPLGGNRKGKGRTVLNKLIVFFLCGLWHGASWTFVIWGLVHGLFLMVEELTGFTKRIPRWLGHLYALAVVCLTFVIFRADDMVQATGIWRAMVMGWDFSRPAMEVAMAPLTPLFLTCLAVGLVAALPVGPWLRARLEKGQGAVPAVVQPVTYGLAMVVLALAFVTLSSGAYNPFIYFRF